MSIPSNPEDGTGSGDVRTVELAEDERRYVLLIDGERVGTTAYVDHGAQRVFVHTEIDMNQSGKGLGSTLVSGALADVRARGLRVVAICPFTAAYLRGHREYDDIVDPVTPRLKADLREAHLL
ncbi:GNAT family N-acetyltransferase [Cryobacterium arcticum]|uniref:Acetyltransferase family protein n=1 Tax=Cryobacterium arcticum TaxID=670052 RepID=A0A1B1BFK7_9MICO|nr:GNAT family N-acetyltransferase [Cryobacterium arcticum]ANP71354.1 Acetyltransferase family protein [Cryobacterium arcticum]